MDWNFVLLMILQMVGETQYFQYWAIGSAPVWPANQHIWYRMIILRVGKCTSCPFLYFGYMATRIHRAAFGSAESTEKVACLGNWRWSWLSDKHRHSSGRTCMGEKGKIQQSTMVTYSRVITVGAETYLGGKWTGRGDWQRTGRSQGWLPSSSVSTGYVAETHSTVVHCGFCKRWCSPMSTSQDRVALYILQGT